MGPPPGLESLLDRLEDAWRDGESPPDARAFAPADAPACVAAEVAHVDLEHRVRRGLRASAAGYAALFPSLAGSAELAELVAAEGRYRARAARLPARYELGGEVGRGSFGVVYRALDRELGRAVAVKLFGFDSGEARALAALDHSRVLPVFDAGPGWLVTPLAAGDLAGRLALGPLPVRQAAELVAGVADALAHAHARGIVHRDVKPANVLLDADGRPWLADFGLANAGDAPAGTPAFMAPEQQHGRADARSDVFSLGRLLESCLGTDAPGRLRRVVRRATRAEPGRRHADAAAFAADLRRAARPDPFPALALVAVVFVVVLASASSAPAPAAPPDWREVRRRAAELAAVRVLARTDRQAGRAELADRAYRAAVAGSADLLDVPPATAALGNELANACLTLGNLHADAGRPADSLPCFARAAEVLSAPRPPESDTPAARRQLAECCYYAGNQARRLGRPADAERWHRRGRDALAPLAGDPEADRLREALARR